MTRGAPTLEIAPGDDLPASDNTAGDIARLRAANLWFRHNPWPAPFDATTHTLKTADSRNLAWIADQSVDLIITSPPYWTLKDYGGDSGSQLGSIQDYDAFLDELDRVWAECARVLVPGGRICCIVGDVCVPRRRFGRHLVMPLHADCQVRARNHGLDCLTPILWGKIANGATESKGNGSGYYGKPYQPGGIVKNDLEHILFFRKGGGYRSVTPIQKALSMLTREEMQTWYRSLWTDIPGASTKAGHPAPFPVKLAERLIRMFSYAGDVILDPFVGSGTTSLAAAKTGRNSIGVDIDYDYIDLATRRLRDLADRPRLTGATSLRIRTDRAGRHPGP